MDSPQDLVEATWVHVRSLRSSIDKVVDFGAGDGRFSKGGEYAHYVGYEIDTERFQDLDLPPSAELVSDCAFNTDITDADLCIGNPPFVRNQDLPAGWRQRASELLFKRTGIELSGLSNAWQYFFLLSLASTKPDGLCALVIPYEWVSRPSARILRQYIQSNKWNVDVYRLIDATFSSVLTTSSITIVDKSAKEGAWRYFEEREDGAFEQIPSASGSKDGVIQYAKIGDLPKAGPRVIRGLSPGTQKVLTLTEGERSRLGLERDVDVVPCITTLRHLPSGVTELNEHTFKRYYREANQKCWLIRTDVELSKNLSAYLESVPSEMYQTATCLERETWWKFKMPKPPNALLAMSFRGKFPKVAKNALDARAVGGVYGAYNLTPSQADFLVEGLGGMDLRGRVVTHSNGMRKVEINQINYLLNETLREVG